jgi:pimeloyl-ACP methyl ester carboxylesterase
MYEPPYNDDPRAKRAWRHYITHLTELLAADRRGDAAALFLKVTGMPDEQIEGMRHAPVWPMFEALAPTLAYDHTAILGEEASVPIERAALVTAPTLVMYGTASYPFMADTAQALGKAIPHAQVHSLEGQGYNVEASALAPVLEEFFTP